MDTLYTIIGIAVLIFSICVIATVHEFGHYGVGRLLGFTILEFSIGMGPTLFKKEKNGIIYSLRALPIGGMCRFYGEDEDLPQTSPDAVPFNRQKVWKRALVVLAGPVMNILFALILATGVVAVYGDYMPQVVEFSFENSPAQQAGLKSGDIILGLDGRNVKYFNEISDIVLKADGEKSTVAFERDGERMTAVIRDFYDPEAGRNIMGIGFTAARKQYGFFEAAAHSTEYVFGVAAQTVEAIGTGIASLFNPKIESELEVGSVVAAGEYMIAAVQISLDTVLQLVVLICLSVGIFNVLPFPALDGGRLAFMAVEAIRGKPVPPEKEGLVHLIGFGLLMALMVFLVISDVMNIAGGG